VNRIVLLHLVCGSTGIPFSCVDHIYGPSLKMSGSVVVDEESRHGLIF
jgi:hypothetical protein